MAMILHKNGQVYDITHSGGIMNLAAQPAALPTMQLSSGAHLIDPAQAAAQNQYAHAMPAGLTEQQQFDYLNPPRTAPQGMTSLAPQPVARPVQQTMAPQPAMTPQQVQQRLNSAPQQAQGNPNAPLFNVAVPLAMQAQPAAGQGAGLGMGIGQQPAGQQFQANPNYVMGQMPQPGPIIAASMNPAAMPFAANQPLG
jgi:hypothetical protein